MISLSYLSSTGFTGFDSIMYTEKKPMLIKYIIAIKLYDVYLRLCLFDCILRYRFAVRPGGKVEFARYREELM